MGDHHHRGKEVLPLPTGALTHGEEWLYQGSVCHWESLGLGLGRALGTPEPGADGHAGTSDQKCLRGKGI